MTRYYLEITCQVLGIDAADVFDVTADAVYDLTGVHDADLGQCGDLLDFTMTVDADSAPEALTTGLSAVRAAIHAAGGSTPGWEKHFETIRQVVQRASTLLPA